MAYEEHYKRSLLLLIIIDSIFLWKLNVSASIRIFIYSAHLLSHTHVQLCLCDSFYFGDKTVLNNLLIELSSLEFWRIHISSSRLVSDFFFLVHFTLENVPQIIRGSFITLYNASLCRQLLVSDSFPEMWKDPKKKFTFPHYLSASGCLSDIFFSFSLSSLKIIYIYGKFLSIILELFVKSEILNKK